MSDNATKSLRDEFRGTSMIDPTRIFGFPDVDNGAPAVMTDHPEFPNPRTSPVDEGMIGDIREAGEFLEPVKLYEYENDGEPVVILVDGKTRLTAVAREWAENPDTNAFAAVPFVLLEGTPNEIRMLMAKYNIEDTRRALSGLETAKHLLYMEQVHGMTEEEQARFLNKENRGGIRWIREMKRVAGLPDVTEAVVTGKIDETTAKEVAKIQEPEARQEVINQVVEAKAEGKTEREARKEVVLPEGATTTATTNAAPAAGKQATTLAPQSKTTLGWKETFQALSDFYPEAKKAIVEPLDVDAIDWTDEGQRLAYVTQQETVARYNEFVKFLKLDKMKAPAVFDQIESWLKPDEYDSMKLVRHPNQKFKPAPKVEAPKPATAKGKTAAKGKGATAKKGGAKGATGKGSGATARPAGGKKPAAGGARK